jgi:DNA-binding transcriptional MerR regulator
MGCIRTNAAAAMLGVSPNTLRSWERRFGFPEPQRTAGGHRQFELTQIEALRCAFEETHNISSAVELARERGTGPATPSRLRSAFARFDETEADGVLEESLAVRSVERTVEEVLLPGVEALDADGEGAGPEYGFAWRWATGWLAAAMRVAPPASRREGVLVFDASAPCDMDALHAQALELCLRRRGLRTLTLTVALDPSRLTRALHALSPRAVVLTGRRASLDGLGRLVYAARRVGGDAVTVYDFRGALPTTGASTVPRLGDAPLAACEQLIEGLEEPVVAVDERPVLLAVGDAR